MRLLNRIFKLSLVSATFMLLIACGKSNDQVILPPIQTIPWELDGNGFVQFSTNDPQYYQYFFWKTYTETYEALMTTVTATVKKESGCLNSGYGMVFCSQDNDNLYLLLITASGHYKVVKKAGGNYSDIFSWATSTCLNTGLGVENRISVTQGPLYNFSINFNGTEERTFNAYEFQGGRAGFVAYVSSKANENFPYTPENIRFKLTLPVPYP